MSRVYYNKFYDQLFISHDCLFYAYTEIDYEMCCAVIDFSSDWELVGQI